MKISLKATSKVIVLVLSMEIILCSCYYQQKLEYYSENDNYVNATGIVDYISYNEEDNIIYFSFSETTPEFDGTSFKIVGENVMIVKKQGMDDKIHIGDQIDFVTAPKYFGDGYVMPIVAISIGGEELLGFEEGIDNFLEFLK